MNTNRASARVWVLAIIALVMGGLVASTNIANATGNSGDDAVVKAWVDCDGDVNVTSTKDISNVVVDFASAPDYKYDGLSGKSFSFSYTDDMVGVWIKSGNNDSGDGPGYGQYVALSAPTDCEPDPVCEDESATNTGEPLPCEYADPDYAVTLTLTRDCDGNLASGVVSASPTPRLDALYVIFGGGAFVVIGENDGSVELTSDQLMSLLDPPVGWFEYGAGGQAIPINVVINDADDCGSVSEPVVAINIVPATECGTYPTGSGSFTLNEEAFTGLFALAWVGNTRPEPQGAGSEETTISFDFSSFSPGDVVNAQTVLFTYGGTFQGLVWESEVVQVTIPADCPDPDPVCEDEDATNVGEPLPCEYPDPDPVCEDEKATNTGEPLPCKYPTPNPDPVCEDPKATNTGGKLPCTYPPKPPVTPPAPVPSTPVKTPAPETT